MQAVESGEWRVESGERRAESGERRADESRVVVAITSSVLLAGSTHVSHY
jgi:hypothetical protein